jgi:hypothetical protein
MIVDGGFNAQSLIVDGFTFSEKDRDRFAAVKAFAREAGVSVWYSCTVKGPEPLYDKRNIPLLIRDYVDLFAVVVVMEPRPDHIKLTVSKDRDTYNPEQMALRLDPKTLLMLEE